MSEHINKTIEDAEQRRRDQLSGVADTEKLINGLLHMIGQPPRYADRGSPSAIVSGVRRGDEYYGKALAWVVRNILENRHQTGTGPATVA
ncbi:MAG TPA: hypothetical protein VGG30_06955, partial [Pirellulales bacterium]